MSFVEMLKNDYGIGERALDLYFGASEEASGHYKIIDENAEFNSLRVLAAMQKNRLSETHFTSVTGYGYNDPGREATEKIYADIFKSEAGLVRPQMISGTHALTIALSGNLSHGDTLLLPAGKPYDTLTKVIGIKKARASLKENGVDHIIIDLNGDESFNYDEIGRTISTNKIRMAAIQRSKGYSLRRSFSNEEIGRLIKFIKNADKNIICMVDNCYGEFVEKTEPGDHGADLTVGSLIKNPGGGISPAGGYICGKNELVENCAYRLTAPGLGKDVGPTLGLTNRVLQGLFLAPGVVAAALKAAVFASVIFNKLGFETTPKPGDFRTDIVQTIRFNDKKFAEIFIQGIQKGSPVDGFVTPVPAPMPGYDCEIIMAAGTFTQGSSIELSADAPLREPYAAFLQGGLSYDYARLGIIIAVDHLLKNSD